MHAHAESLFCDSHLAWLFDGEALPPQSLSSFLAEENAIDVKDVCKHYCCLKT